MSANPAPANLEVVTLPIGNGWRVRISDGQRLQFVGSVDTKASAADRVRHSSPAWLTRLKKFAALSQA